MCCLHYTQPRMHSEKCGTGTCWIFSDTCAHFHTIMSTKLRVPNLFVTRLVKVRNLIMMVLVTVCDMSHGCTHHHSLWSALFWDITWHNYHCMLCNFQEESRSHLLCSTGLQSHTIIPRTILTSTTSPFHLCTHMQLQEVVQKLALVCDEVLMCMLLHRSNKGVCLQCFIGKEHGYNSTDSEGTN